MDDFEGDNNNLYCSWAVYWNIAYVNLEELNSFFFEDEHFNHHYSAIKNLSNKNKLTGSFNEMFDENQSVLKCTVTCKLMSISYVYFT